jgi:hypothetical protein
MAQIEYEIKKISVLRCGVFFSIFFLAIGILTGLSAIKTESFLLGFLSLFILALIYFMVGFVIGVIESVIYNIIAKKFPIKIHLKKVSLK